MVVPPEPVFVVVPPVVVVLVVVADGAVLATVWTATLAVTGTTFVTLGTDVADLLFGRAVGAVTGRTKLAAST